MLMAYTIIPLMEGMLRLVFKCILELLKRGSVTISGPIVLLTFPSYSAACNWTPSSVLKMSLPFYPITVSTNNTAIISITAALGLRSSSRALR